MFSAAVEAGGNCSYCKLADRQFGDLPARNYSRDLWFRSNLGFVYSLYCYYYCGGDDDGGMLRSVLFADGDAAGDDDDVNGGRDGRLSLG